MHCRVLLDLFNWTVAHMNGNQKQHTIIQSHSTGVCPTVLFCLGSTSVLVCMCTYIFTELQLLPFFVPWLLASSFPSNIDTHLFKSIAIPIVTDSFGGKNKFTCQLEQRSKGMGEQQGERSGGSGIFQLTDHKTFSNNIFKGCIILH